MLLCGAGDRCLSPASTGQNGLRLCRSVLQSRSFYQRRDDLGKSASPSVS